MRRILVAAVVAVALLGACAAGDGDDGDSAAGRRPGAADVSGGGGDAEGSGAAASCVEEYSPETLANRDFAFDGTLISLDPAPDGDRVAFQVNARYHGDVGDEVTLRTSVPAGAVTSAGSLELTEGERYLVAGDNGFVWACGFTQPWSPEAAAQWEAVFEG